MPGTVTQSLGNIIESASVFVAGHWSNRRSPPAEHGHCEEPNDGFVHVDLEDSMSLA